MKYPIISVRLRMEQDLVAIRHRARQIAGLAGFDAQDQVRVATAVSEIARNAVRYAAGGRVEFGIDGQHAGAQMLVVRVADEGPGISDVAAILSGRYTSQTGMGMGIQGARRLMDRFDLQTTPGAGTTITMGKLLPKRAGALTATKIARISEQLAQAVAPDPFEEMQTQNQELLRALDELRRRQDEMAQLNRELEETNRGVMALYAELDERAEHLKQADQLKSTFLSHMSHEFRTPLNSVMALSQILLQRLDGPLTEEQEKQVGFILRAAQELTDLVNDLLDLAKVEAGKVEVHPTRWPLSSVLGTLRGLMRPLVANTPVQFIIDEPEDIPELVQDESKISQILRNFVSNAIKFTERGEIRVTSSYNRESNELRVSVSDTGIGIAPDDQGRIFDQFVQLHASRQGRVRGTGLGLPLSKKLAALVGGSISVHSVVGEGSTFTLTIPIELGMDGAPVRQTTAKQRPARRSRVLVIDDEDVSRYLVQKQLSGLNVELLEADNGPDGLSMARRTGPDVIVLDMVMPGMDGRQVLQELRGDPDLRDIPVIVHTSKGIRQADRLALGDVPVVSKAVSEGGGTGLRQAIEKVIAGLVAY